MNAFTVLGWAACGAAVGLLARVMIRGRQRLGLTTTVGLGIAGALAGGFVFWAIQKELGRPYSLSVDGWHGWAVAAVGASAVLLCYLKLNPKRRWWQP